MTSASKPKRYAVSESVFPGRQLRPRRTATRTRL